jgi:hypothetical protein
MELHHSSEHQAFKKVIKLFHNTALVDGLFDFAVVSGTTLPGMHYDKGFHLDMRCFRSRPYMGTSRRGMISE